MLCSVMNNKNNSIFSNVTYCSLWAFWFRFPCFLHWLRTLLQPLIEKHIQKTDAGGQLAKSPVWNVDSNLESLCERKKNENRGQNLAGKRCSDLAWNLATWQKQSGIVECGRRGTCDRWERERGPPLRKTVHKAPFTTQVPSATCGAREGLRQRPPTQPIGCKISSSPSWIAEEVGNTKEKERRRMRGQKEDWGLSLGPSKTRECSVWVLKVQIETLLCAGTAATHAWF